MEEVSLKDGFGFRYKQGGGEYGVDVPYLPRETADGLYAYLSSAAATTAFQW